MLKKLNENFCNIDAENYPLYIQNFNQFSNYDQLITETHRALTLDKINKCKEIFEENYKGKMQQYEEFDQLCDRAISELSRKFPAY